MKLIDKSALVAEIERRIKTNKECMLGLRNLDYYQGKVDALNDTISSLNTLEVKDLVESKQPEYSCLETIYQCGKKPHWNIGDTLAYYESCSDREGECVLGKVTRVELEEDENDWFYTFEDGSQYDEASLLEEKTYKKK